MISSITGRTFASFANLGQMIASLHKAYDDEVGDVIRISLHPWETLRDDLNEIKRISIELELDATIDALSYVLDIFDRSIPQNNFVILSKSNVERLVWTMQTVRMNFSSQMQSRLVLVMGTKSAHYLTSDDPPFGRLVEDVFPTASEEVSEAAKCLALQRPTAVVFHLMRAMELAVQRMARALGRNDPAEKVWGIILSDIDSEIQKMPKGAARDAWSACHTHLYHVKQAWRNDTMHPKTTYTEVQAGTVFEAVKSFMMHLAILVSEAEEFS